VPNISFLKYALFYATRMLWPVLPVREKEKDPPLTPHGCKDASLDEAQVREWWKKNPRANIALATGVKFWVLDIDPRHGGDETLRLLIAKHGPLPDTVQAMTGGGGRHYLFALPGNGFIIKSGKLGEGIDVKARGGYILAAPSIHPSGAPYAWDGAVPIHKQVILSAPNWLLMGMEAERFSKAGKLKLSERIKKGVQHDTLFRLGCSMREKGFGEKEIFAALWAANQDRCEEPGPRENIVELARSICSQYAPGQTGAGKAVDPATLPKLVGVDGETIYSAPVKEVKAIVDGFIYPGCTIFNARPKIGKSWLMLQTAIGVVTGSIIAGRLRVTEPGKVLYIALEETEARTTRRMKKLTPPSDFLKDITFIYRRDIEAAASGGIAQIEEYLKTHPGTRLVVIDTFLAFQRVERKRTNDLLLSDRWPSWPPSTTSPSSSWITPARRRAMPSTC
jgi:Bifunctional DNA primase/polymerase, N-terminal/AAA domain/Primase C terminal 1 (PriCT-1)